ncbi:PH domain-containing protein [Patiriisocius marinus]|uniref:Uncharacterized protein YyaB-like PH domain-containing protein n=1 Tax=Patiriisocius marinus TaxID=1397112 RepID=A0A5J4J117_9FLAO|nr:PH domain-containing protein [Patiriisocius marinus]GER59678.1 hypothetical protein ULMA_17860 [Patiriisocius marinus]
MKKFKSKVNYLMLVALVVFIGFLCFQGIDFQKLTTLRKVYLIGMVLLLKYIIYSFLNTYYLVDREHLTLVVKPFYKKNIAINSIKRIERSSSLMSAPAPSFKRLEIFYGSFNSELVSPKDQKAFVELLKKYNPEITVKL